MSPEPERNSYTRRSSKGEIKDFLSDDRDCTKNTGEQAGLGKAGEKRKKKKALNYERSRYINS